MTSNRSCRAIQLEAVGVALLMIKHQQWRPPSSYSGKVAPSPSTLTTLDLVKTQVESFWRLRKCLLCWLLHLELPLAARVPLKEDQYGALLIVSISKGSPCTSLSFLSATHDASDTQRKNAFEAAMSLGGSLERSSESTGALVRSEPVTEHGTLSKLRSTFNTVLQHPSQLVLIHEE